MNEIPPDVLCDFVAVKRKIVKPVKDAKNPHFGNKYANLEGVIDSINTAIEESGLGFDFMQSVSFIGENKINVDTTLISAIADTGEASHFTISTQLPVVRLSPQDAGSAFTYAKRYALMSIFGIVAADEDDDGNKASTNRTEAPKKAPPKEEKKEDKKEDKAPVLFDARNTQMLNWFQEALTAAEVPDELWKDIGKRLQGKPMKDLS